MTRRTIFLHVFFIAMTISSVYYMLALSRQGASLMNQFAPRGVISFELAKNDTAAQQIASQWVQDDLATHAIEQIQLDYRFIACYALAFASACLLLIGSFRRRRAVDPPVGVVTPRSATTGMWLGWGLLAGSLLAGGLDVIENLAMQANLRAAMADRLIDASLRQRAYLAAWTKFLLVFIAFTYVLAGVMLLKWHHLGWFLRRVYLTRVPILIGIVLQAMALLAIAGPPTIQNLLITTSFYEPMLISFQVVLTYVLGVFAARVICRQANPDGRFHVPDSRGVPAILDAIRSRTPEERQARRHRPSNWFAMIMCSPLLLVVVAKTEISETWWVGASLAITAVFAGAILAFLLLFLIRDEWTGPAVERVKNLKAFGKLGERIESWVGPGYADPDGDLSRDHVRAGVTLAVLSIFYATAYLFFRPDSAWCDLVPAFAYVLGWLILLMSLLCGATYLLDRFHVPLLTVLLLWNVVVFSIGGVDHYFVLYTSGAREDVRSMAAVEPQNESMDARQFKVAGGEVEEQSPPSGLPTPRQALLKRWELTEPDDGGPRVVTVVCAAGGGIQAAGWTARALNGLCEDALFGKKFQKSLALISSTSGGSVGAMHFLEAFPPATVASPTAGQMKQYALPNAKALEYVFAASVTSSLEESVWGLTLPDTLRLLLPLPIFDPVLDRSWAIEQAWIRNGRAVREAAASVSPGAHGAPQRWSSWVELTRAGRIPAVVFNTTVVETGSQMRISTVTTDGSFHQYYSDLEEVDMDVATAARLSATFPYITPVARAHIHNGKKLGVSPPTWHFADGGYFDNSGILATIDWLRAILEDSETRKKIDKVLVIQITPFPPSGDSNPYSDAKGWMNAALGPITTIANVRSSTQIARGQLELDLLADSHPELIHRVVIRPMGLYQGQSPPLSWHLAKHNKDGLKDSWLRLHTNGSQSLKTIRNVFGH